MADDIELLQSSLELAGKRPEYSGKSNHCQSAKKALVLLSSSFSDRKIQPELAAVAVTFVSTIRNLFSKTIYPEGKRSVTPEARGGLCGRNIQNIHSL